MKKTPLVSVIIPTYNRAKLLPRAIDSVLNQTYKNFELIIIDDKSKDETLKVIKRYAKSDKRIKYYINKYSKGPSGARNYGLDNAKGKCVAFLDDDDEYLPTKLEKQVKSATKYKLDCLFTNNYIMLKENTFPKIKKKIKKKYIYEKKKDNLLILNNSQKLRIAYLKRCFFCLDTIILRKNNILFNENLRFGQDRDYIYRILKNAKRAGYINETLCIHHAHKRSGSLSPLNHKRFKQKLKILDVFHELYKTKEFTKVLTLWESNLYFDYGYSMFLKNNFNTSEKFLKKSFKIKPNLKALKVLLICKIIPKNLLIEYNHKRN